VKVTVIAVGSRGDVQPYVALAAGLQDAGHEVTLATHGRYASLVRDLPIDLSPIAEGALNRGAEMPEGRRWLEKESRFLPVWVGFLRDGRSVATRRLRDCRDACDGAEVIVVSLWGTVPGYQLAEHMRVPLVRAYPTPINALASKLLRQALWLGSRRWLNAARRDVLGAPPLPWGELSSILDRRRVPLLYGFSPAVVSLEAQPDWAHVTGYWFLDSPAEWEPPPQLGEFLALGPPPVFVGFGSMADRKPEATAELVVEALTRAGQRGILQLPTATKYRPLTRDVLVVDTIPHDWLFQRVLAAVHHGGAGTTAASLRAGLPSVVVPFIVDQQFWGRRVHELGAGPLPIRRRDLSAANLAQAIHVAATDSRVREHAAVIGDHIRSENGVARAVEAFERDVVRRWDDTVATQWGG